MQAVDGTANHESPVTVPPRSVMGVASLIGGRLADVHGEAVGDVVDVTIDVVSGEVAYVVVAVGAVLGLGGERFAVPWRAMRATGGTLRTSVDRETLLRAPVVEPDFWPEMSEDERWARAVHEHFGVEPYWSAPR